MEYKTLRNFIVTTLLCTTLTSCTQWDIANAITDDRKTEIKSRWNWLDTLYHLKMSHRWGNMIDSYKQYLMANKHKMSDNLVNDFERLIELDATMKTLVSQYQYGIYHYLKNSEKSIVWVSESVFGNPDDWLVKIHPSQRANAYTYLEEIEASKSYEDLSDDAKRLISQFGGDELYMIAQGQWITTSPIRHNIQEWIAKQQRAFFNNKMAAIQRTGDTTWYNFWAFDRREEVMVGNMKKVAWNYVVMWSNHDFNDKFDWTVVELSLDQLSDQIKNTIKEMDEISRRIWRATGY